MSDFQGWQSQRIKSVFCSGGIPLTEHQAQLFCCYGEFLQQKNAETNLTAITAPEEVTVKHFFDSALVADFVPEGATLCDVGCGAGFPSAVVKILRPDVNVTAVDSVGKKTRFVQQLFEKLGLSAEVVNARAEQLAQDRRETFDVVCARAVANLVTLLEYLAPLVKVGGIVLAQKGKDGKEEQSQAEYCARVLGLQLVESKDFTLPNGDQRVILQYKKVFSTPKKYPRPQNAPRKNPLLHGEYKKA